MTEKSLSDSVSKYIYPKLTTIAAELTVSDAAKIMIEKMVESIIVFENESVVGIITDRDILNDVVAEGLDPLKIKVSQVMRKPILTIPKDATVREAIKIMAENNIRRLLVMDDSRPLGIIRRKQLSGVLHVRRVILPELEHPTIFTCPYCREKFDSLESISKHINENHFK
ncbi:MAG TPA: CBS domain-containing protein [Nitrosopumilaceae archaeon]|nr:CBS domain-containing protein [Nitrosopumilaceae archaeon]